jgi:hypothetical protein
LGNTIEDLPLKKEAELVNWSSPLQYVIEVDLASFPFQLISFTEELNSYL